MAAVGGHPHAFDVAITHEERVAVGGVGRPVATTQTPSRRPRRDRVGDAGGSRRDDPQAVSRGALAQLPAGVKSGPHREQTQESGRAFSVSAHPWSSPRRPHGR
jgi:hypothetical protein